MGRRLSLLLGFLLTVAVLGVYSPVWSGRYQFLGYDDPAYVTGNLMVRKGLSTEGWRWAWTTFHASNWHPLTWLSHMLDCDLFGPGPGEVPAQSAAAHHAVNVIFHAANTLLLFVILRRMTGSIWRSALVAALFGLHPLHVESVAWIAERKDVLSTFFGLLALAAYSHYVARPSVFRYLPLMMAFVLSLLAKPMQVTMPFLFLLLDWWPLRRLTGAPLIPRVRRLVFEKVPLVVLSAACCVVTVQAQTAHALVSLNRLPMEARLTNSLLAYSGYLYKTIYPVDLAAFYPHSASRASSWAVLGAGAVLAVLTTLAVLLRHCQPAVLVGWFWYLGTLVPVIGLVQVGEQSMADRYTYFPLIGIFLALAWGIPGGIGEFFGGRVVLGIGVSAVLVACILLTRTQLTSWQNDETLWRHALAVNPDNAMAHQGLGTYLLENDRYRMDEGESHLERATQLDPNNALALHNLGIARLLEDKPEEARALLQRAAENAPGVWRYHDSLGRAQLQTNRLKEAAESFEEAILLGPDVGDPYFDLAATKAKQGDIPASVALYQEGLRWDPDWPQRNLALVLNLLGLPNPRFRGKQEVLLSAQQINAATGGSNPMVLLVLAEAQARADLLRDATKTARRALEVAKEFGNVDLAQRAEWAIKSYEAAPLKR